MKKLLSLVLILACILAVGCGNSSSSDETTTTTPKATTTTKATTSATTTTTSTNEKPNPGKSIVTVATPYTDLFDLTAEGTVYWEHYGKLEESDTNDLHSKAGATDIIETSFGGSQYHWDNKAEIAWTDGADVPVANTLHGVNSPNSIVVSINPAGCTEIKLLVGVWNATNEMTIYDADDEEIETVTVVSAGGDATMALVTLDVSEYTGDTIEIIFITVDAINGGNVSLSAVAVK